MYFFKKKILNMLFIDYHILMKTSKGRDKFCNLVQVYANFYLLCMKNTNIVKIKWLYDNDKLLEKRITKNIIE